jgi:putative hydrolase of the HAD superfamily
MLNKNIKGIIFDYGGTIDTAGCHWGKFLWHAYQRQEVPVKEQDFRDAYVYTERFLGNNPIIQPTFTFRKTLDIKIRIEMEQLCTSGAWLADEESFKLKHQAVLNDVYGEVQKITSHSKTVLRELHEHYPMILVSNFYGNINEVLKEFDIDDMFEYVIESAVVKVRKPNPRIFAMGVEALAMKANETIVVGDSFYKDIEPAHKLGCYTAWFKGEGWDNKEYDESMPDMIINDLAQLL